MPWVKLDDQFFLNPKIVAAGRDARDLYLAALTYTAGQLTDGFVAEGALMLVAAMAGVSNAPELVDRLVAVRLWEPVTGGYEIHDYHNYNPSAEKVRAERAVNAKRQAEWRDGHRDEAGQYQADDAPRNAVSNGVTNAEVTTAPFPSPFPSPSPNPVPQSEMGVAEPPPVRAAAPKERKPSERDLKRRALQDHFIRRTKLPDPQDRTATQRKSAGALWWAPLREIGDLTQWDVDDGKRLIDRALEKLADMTVSDPNSIIKTVRSLSAEHGRAAIGIDDEAQAVMRRIEQDRVRFGGGVSHGETEGNGETGAAPRRPDTVPIREVAVGGAAARQQIDPGEARAARARWRART